MTVATDFATDLLAALNAPPSAANVDALVSWQAGENTAARYNPLATTHREPGSTDYNVNAGFPVQNYPTYDVGLHATAATLVNGHYQPILDALTAGDNAQRVLEAVRASPWGTKTFGRADWPGKPANARGGPMLCPFATWLPTGNHSGPMSAHLGLILHVQEGNGSLAGYFGNPNTPASSTWWAAKNGNLEQYVDSNLAAWAQAAGNSTYNSVETEGFVGEPLTDAQISTLARLYAWGHANHGWPYQEANQPGEAGFGVHYMGGAAWGGHPCPGPTRAGQRPAILAAAQSQKPAEPTPPTRKRTTMFVVNCNGRVYTIDGGFKAYVWEPKEIPGLLAVAGQTAPTPIGPQTLAGFGTAPGATPPPA